MNVSKRTQKKPKNKTISGKRKPLTLEVVAKMHAKPLTALKLQRQAQPYYKTQRLENLVILTNEINGKWCKIWLSKDEYGYITVKSSTTTATFQTPMPKSAKDLFIKLLRHKLV